MTYTYVQQEYNNAAYMFETMKYMSARQLIVIFASAVIGHHVALVLNTTTVYGS